MLASVGLPGLCGFVGEFLVLIGTFAAYKTWAATGMPGFFPQPKVLARHRRDRASSWRRCTCSTMFQKLMFGPLDKPENKTRRATSTAARPGCSASWSSPRW